MEQLTQYLLNKKLLAMFEQVACQNCQKAYSYPFLFQIHQEYAHSLNKYPSNIQVATIYRDFNSQFSTVVDQFTHGQKEKNSEYYRFISISHLLSKEINLAYSNLITSIWMTPDQPGFIHGKSLNRLLAYSLFSEIQDYRNMIGDVLAFHILEDQINSVFQLLRTVMGFYFVDRFKNLVDVLSEMKKREEITEKRKDMLDILLLQIMIKTKEYREGKEIGREIIQRQANQSEMKVLAEFYLTKIREGSMASQVQDQNSMREEKSPGQLLKKFMENFQISTKESQRRFRSKLTQNQQEKEEKVMKQELYKKQRRKQNKRQEKEAMPLNREFYKLLSSSCYYLLIQLDPNSDDKKFWEEQLLSICEHQYPLFTQTIINDYYDELRKCDDPVELRNLKDKIERNCQVLISKNPWWALSYVFILKMYHYHSNQSKEALQLVEKGLKKYSESLTLKKWKGILLLAENKICEAEKIFKQILAVCQKEGMPEKENMIKNQLCLLYHKVNRKRKCKEMLESIVNPSKQQLTIYMYIKGLELHNEGREEESLKFLLQAGETPHAFAEIHLEIGRILEKQGKFDNAIEEYNKSISINCLLYEGCQRLAICYEKLERDGWQQKVQGIYWKIIQNAPDLFMGYNQLACYYIRQQNCFQGAIIEGQACSGFQTISKKYLNNNIKSNGISITKEQEQDGLLEIVSRNMENMKKQDYIHGDSAFYYNVGRYFFFVLYARSESRLIEKDEGKYEVLIFLLEKSIELNQKQMKKMFGDEMDNEEIRNCEMFQNKVFEKNLAQTALALIYMRTMLKEKGISELKKTLQLEGLMNENFVKNSEYCNQMKYYCKEIESFYEKIRFYESEETVIPSKETRLEIKRIIEQFFNNFLYSYNRVGNQDSNDMETQEERLQFEEIIKKLLHFGIDGLKKEVNFVEMTRIVEKLYYLQEDNFQIVPFLFTLLIYKVNQQFLNQNTSNLTDQTFLRTYETIENHNEKIIEGLRKEFPQIDSRIKEHQIGIKEINNGICQQILELHMKKLTGIHSLIDSVKQLDKEAEKIEPIFKKMLGQYFQNRGVFVFKANRKLQGKQSLYKVNLRIMEKVLQKQMKDNESMKENISELKKRVKFQSMKQFNQSKDTDKKIEDLFESLFGVMKQHLNQYFTSEKDSKKFDLLLTDLVRGKAVFEKEQNLIEALSETNLSQLFEKHQESQKVAIRLISIRNRTLQQYPQVHDVMLLFSIDKTICELQLSVGKQSQQSQVSKKFEFGHKLYEIKRSSEVFGIIFGIFLLSGKKQDPRFIKYLKNNIRNIKNLCEGENQENNLMEIFKILEIQHD